MSEAEFTIDSYCWRDSLVFRYESLWSVLQKFALLNAVGGITIREIFGEKGLGKNLHDSWRFKNRNDLRSSGGLDLEKLSFLFNRNEDRINESVTTTFLNYNEIEPLSVENLRFCRSCIEEGFHSAIYQLLFIKICPYHEEKFISQCPNCECEIPYTLGKASFSEPYKCPTCCFKLCKDLFNLGCVLPSDPEREEKLKLVINWLISRKTSPILEKKISPTKNLSNNKDGQRDLINNLSSHWSVVLTSDNKLKNILGSGIISNRSIFLIKVDFKSVKKFEGSSFLNFEKSNITNEELDKDLYSIYKSIARFFLKSYLYTHKNCIEKVGRTIWWDKYTLNCTGQICKIANAFLLWRMFFEGINYPTDLFRKFKGKTFERLHINWQPPNYRVPVALIKRIFAVECFWMFYECILVSQKLYDENIYSFNYTEYVKGDQIPHWSINKVNGNNLEENYTIYYWSEPSRLMKMWGCLEPHYIEQIDDIGGSFS